MASFDLLEPGMSLATARFTMSLDSPSTTPWINTATGLAIFAMPAIASILAVGILLGERPASAVMTAAAVTLGFGAYKRLYGSAGPAMMVTAVGMGISAFVGTIAGQSWEFLLLVVFLWGFVTGLLPILKSDLTWIGQQCTIVLLVASAFAGSLEHAAERALLVFGGSLIQLLCVTALVWLLARDSIVLPTDWRRQTHDFGAALVVAVRSKTAAVGLALRLAAVLALAVELWRWFQWRNGYWLGMTVLLLVRPEFRDTFLRAGERIAGTILGALLATLLVHELPRASLPGVSAGLTAAFAFLTLMFQQGNRIGSRTMNYPGSYALFAGCLTAYVVFLLDYGGFSQREVAVNRVSWTFLGGALALLVHIPLDFKPAR